MYTQVFYHNSEGEERTRFFLQRLPYNSKFDTLKIVSLQTLLDRMAQITDSICIKTVDTDTVIEWYAKFWSQSQLYRFFFLYDRGRYSLYIVESTKQKINNGVVTATIPHCKVLYRSPMTTLEMAFDAEKMDEFTEEIMLEIEIEIDIEQEFSPSCVFVTTKELYVNAVKVATSLQSGVAGIERKNLKDFLLQHGFWEHVRGKICAANSTPQKQMLPSIFYAMLTGKTISVESLLQLPMKKQDVAICNHVIAAAERKYGSDLIAIDFRQERV